LSGPGRNLSGDRVGCSIKARNESNIFSLVVLVLELEKTYLLKFNIKDLFAKSVEEGLSSQLPLVGML